MFTVPAGAFSFCSCGHQEVLLQLSMLTNFKRFMMAGVHGCIFMESMKEVMLRTFWLEKQDTLLTLHILPEKAGISPLKNIAVSTSEPSCSWSIQSMEDSLMNKYKTFWTIWIYHWILSRQLYWVTLKPAKIYSRQQNSSSLCMKLSNSKRMPQDYWRPKITEDGWFWTWFRRGKGGRHGNNFGRGQGDNGGRGGRSHQKIMVEEDKRIFILPTNLETDDTCTKKGILY